MTDAIEGDLPVQQLPEFTADVGSLDGGVGTVTVAGAVDLLTAPQMANAIDGAQRSGAVVLVDLRRVDFLGSAGLSVLVDAARRAEESGGRLAVVATGHAVVHALQVTGLDSVLRLFQDTASASAYLTDGQ